MDKKTGSAITPLVTPLITPEKTPVDIGHMSGGEWQQTHGTPAPRWPKKSGK